VLPVKYEVTDCGHQIFQKKGKKYSRADWYSKNAEEELLFAMFYFELERERMKRIALS